MRAEVDSSERLHGGSPAVTDQGGISLGLTAIILGAATGAAAALCFLAMIALQGVIWSNVGQERWLIFAITLLGGVLIGLTRLPAPALGLETQIAASRTPDAVQLRQTFWIALGGIVAVGFGGAIGPEAGIVAVTAHLSVIVTRRLGKTAAERRTLAKAGISGALSGFYGSPAGGPFHAEEEGRAPKVILFASGVAGFAAFGVLTEVLQPGALAHMRLPRLSAEAEPWDTLIAMLPAAAGALAGGLFLWVSTRLSGLFDRYRVTPFWRPVAGGAALGLLGMTAPILLFSGYAELGEMLRIGQEQGALLLVLLALGKLLACAACIAAGWLGGVVFPMCFVGAAMGAAAMFFLPGIDPLIGVAAGMAAAASVGMTRPLVAGLCLLFILGGGLAVPVFVGTLVGWGALRLLPEALQHGSASHAS